MMGRRTLALTCLLIVSLTVLWSWSETRSVVTSIADLAGTYLHDDDGYCSVDDIVYGQWVDGPPVTTFEEVRIKFNHQVSRMRY